MDDLSEVATSPPKGSGKIFGTYDGKSDTVSNEEETWSPETERTPLTKSTRSSEFSNGSSLYYDAVSSFERSDDESVDIGSAKDLQASHMLPSTRLSSFASIINSYDYFRRAKISSTVSKSAVILSVQFAKDELISLSSTTFNLLPFLLGSATFALPYAIARGGYATIPAFVLITILADFTGWLLVDSLYENGDWRKSKNRIYLDYVDLGKAVAGKCGAWIINIALISYLYSMNIVNLVLLGRSFYIILHNHTSLTFTATTAIFSFLVLPPLFVKSLSKLSYLGMMSSFCIIVGGIASQVIFVKHFDEWGKNSHVIPVFDADWFAYAMGAWFYMLICHPVVPQVEGSMQEPRKYPWALHIAHSTAAIIKIYFGVTGALTFGMAAKPLVSMNIERLSEPINILTSAALAGFAIFSFPINFYVVCETFDTLILRDKYSKFSKRGTYHNLWILLTRPLLVGVGVGIAVSLKYFGSLVGILGSFLGMFLVFVFPCWFHLKLKGRWLPLWRKLLEIAVMVVGIAVGTAGLYASLKGLVNEMKTSNGAL